MIPRQAKCTRTYTLLPYTPLFRSVLGSARRLARDQRVIDQHAEFAGEMVVADARLAQRRFARARTQTHGTRSDEHTSELQSLMRISYAVFCLKKKTAERYSLHCLTVDDIRPYCQISPINCLI